MRSRMLSTLVLAGTLVVGGISPAIAASSDGGGNQGDQCQGQSQGQNNCSNLTPAQRAGLMTIARDTWNFYATDVDPNTHLPLDNIGPAGKRGTYTSAANIGVYLWAVIAANDLGFISRREASSQIRATLTEVKTLRKDHGFLYQWYDTNTGQVIKNPNDVACTKDTPLDFNNCYFISNVDNGWYASGLIMVRSALPNLRGLANQLLNQMDFSLFYDNRPQTACNVNPAVQNGQPTGQMFGSYYVGLPVDQGDNVKYYYHNGALYSDPRISAYIGMGLHQMPGDVWWRSWRVLPPKQCATDPDFSWQGQWPHPGYWQVYHDPQSGKAFNVWEGHYSYLDGNPSFIPTFGGGSFEGLMANLVVPETTWGPRSFGLADVRTAQVQMKYATEALNFPVWGLSPSSTADDTGNYGGYGVDGLLFPPGKGLSQCRGCSGTTEHVVSPHASFIALDVMPQEAYANIQKLRALYPDIYRTDGGFYDAVNPMTHAVGHRDLVLDQSMIMAALDNALNDRAMQRHFAADPVVQLARTYLSMETFSIS